MEISKAGTKNKSPDGLSLPTLSEYNKNKHKIVIFYKKWKKYNEIQLTKNKMETKL